MTVPATASIDAWQSLARGWQAHPRLAHLTRRQTFSVQLEAPGLRCYLLVDEGTITLHPGSHVRPDFTLAGQPEAIDEVLRGRVDVTQPIAGGQLRVAQGDYLRALALSRIFGGLTIKEGTA